MGTFAMSRLASPPAAILVLSSVILVAAATASWSDLLANWYATDPRAAAYAGARADLAQIFTEAAQRHVPERLLANRLTEGEAKGVPAERLVGVLRSELRCLERAQLIMDKAGLGGSFLSPRGDGTLKEIGIYLRAGLPDQLVSELLSEGAGRQGGKESALAACAAIMDLRAVAPLEDADSLQIGKLLLASGMQPSGYASLALVYGLGRSRGLSHEAVVRDVIINTLSAGGGLASMNQKIESTPISEPLPSSPGPATGHPGHPPDKRSRQR
ncbi:MAG TPA: hypothetical protein VL354_17370 [Spirochaetia bacterium]|nr:hypothetical protein [Spirochaetia bacterium]